MKRLIFNLTMVSHTPLHTGCTGIDEVSENLMRRDSTGQIIIPGTSVAGALRNLALKLSAGLGLESCRGIQLHKNSVEDSQTNCTCTVCRLFGEIRPNTESAGTASSLLISHAVVQSLPNRSIQDGVGIERTGRTSARAAAAKFDHELVASNTEFKSNIIWENPPSSDSSEWSQKESEEAGLLAACLAELSEGRMCLGGGTNRGLGAIGLKCIEVLNQDLSDSIQLMNYLENKDSGVELKTWIVDSLKALADFKDHTNSEMPTYALKGFAKITIKLNFDTEVLINDKTNAALHGYAQAPRVEFGEDTCRFMLPGSALRGVIRSQAERIARTLTSIDVKDLSEFCLHCPACDPNVRPVGNEPKSEALACCVALDSAPVEGNHIGETTINITIAENLCLSCQLFGSTLFGSRLRVQGGFTEVPLRGATRIRDFVAIDRFTGGAKGDAKFDALVPNGKTSFDVRFYLENPESWELGWLYLTLRDLAEGYIPVGAGSAKGIGECSFEKAELVLGWLDDRTDFLGLEVHKNTIPSGIFNTISEDWCCDDQSEHVGKITQLWVDAFTARCKPSTSPDSAFDHPPFKRTGKFVCTVDSYFGRTLDDGIELETLYPVGSSS